MALYDAFISYSQRDLSVVYERIGYAQRKQGDLAGALKSFRNSLTISERLAQSDPGNAEWQRDLSVSYNTVGQLCHAVLKALRFSGS
jgi:hypothetical protein